MDSMINQVDCRRVVTVKRVSVEDLLKVICAVCDKEISRTAEFSKDEEGRYMHVHCAEEEARRSGRGRRARFR